jgi:hypothetical protein
LRGKRRRRTPTHTQLVPKMESYIRQRTSTQTAACIHSCVHQSKEHRAKQSRKVDILAVPLLLAASITASRNNTRSVDSYQLATINWSRMQLSQQQPSAEMPLLLCSRITISPHLRSPESPLASTLPAPAGSTAHTAAFCFIASASGCFPVYTPSTVFPVTPRFKPACPSSVSCLYCSLLLECFCFRLLPSIHPIYCLSSHSTLQPCLTQL